MLELKLKAKIYIRKKVVKAKVIKKKNDSQVLTLTLTDVWL